MKPDVKPGTEQQLNVEKKVVVRDTTKKAIAVVVLDVTDSMLTACNRYTRLDLLNMVVRYLYEGLIPIAKVRAALELAFVVFNEKVLLSTDFMSLTGATAEHFKSTDPDYQDRVQLNRVMVTNADNYVFSCDVPTFDTATEDSGTMISTAVFHAVEKLQNRVTERAKHGSGCYAPFLIMVTDGHTDAEKGADYADENEQKAVEMLKSHCSTNHDPSNLIVPVVIGVGGEDIRSEALRAYSGGFVEGFFHVQDQVSEKLIRVIASMICQSITASVTLNSEAVHDRLQELYEATHEEFRDIVNGYSSK